MYTKDLTSLLHLLKLSEQSTILRVMPADQADEEWYALLSLVEGDVTRCHVLRARDKALLLEGPDALRWLTTLGRLAYEEVVSSSGPTRSLSPAPQRPPPVPPPSGQRGTTRPPFNQAGQANVRGARPTRTARGEQEGVAAIAGREHRQVFLLVDGMHTPEEIADVLRKSPDHVRQLLMDLYRQGRIE